MARSHKNVVVEIKINGKLDGSQWFDKLTDKQLEALCERIEDFAYEVSMGDV